MKEQDLLIAIGYADERFLEALEAPAVRRLPKHFALIAAMLALVLTACAAPVLLQNFAALEKGCVVQSSQDLVLEKIWTDSKGHALSVDTDRYSVSKQVSLEVSISPDAPNHIETHQIPLKLLDHAAIESCTDEDALFSLTFSISIPKAGKSSCIQYQQHVLSEDGQMKVEGFLDSGFWETESQTYAGISVLEISGEALYSGSKGSTRAYTKHLFWSDGLYLYCLKLPIVYPLNSSMVEDIVASLTAVEDITPYLPSP